MARTTSVSLPSFGDSVDLGHIEGPWSHRIHQVYGSDARIRQVREASASSGPIFVVDLDNGPRHARLLGAFSSTPLPAVDSDPRLVVLSVMDLIYPAQLLQDHERLMSLAFAMCAQPATALLMGVGGGAMWRFVKAYLPECTSTLVDRDERIAQTARRWFYLDQPVAVDDGESFLSAAAARFDVILVDLSDANGSSRLTPGFWTRCLGALKPGGCIAANWPEFGTSPHEKAMAQAQVDVARSHGHDCFFIAPRDPGGNVVQYLPTEAGYGPDTVGSVLARFADERRLPDESRNILGRYTASRALPVWGTAP